MRKIILSIVLILGSIIANGQIQSRIWIERDGAKIEEKDKLALADLEFDFTRDDGLGNTCVKTEADYGPPHNFIWVSVGQMFSFSNSLFTNCGGFLAGHKMKVFVEVVEKTHNLWGYKGEVEYTLTPNSSANVHTLNLTKEAGPTISIGGGPLTFCEGAGVGTGETGTKLTAVMSDASAANVTWTMTPTATSGSMTSTATEANFANVGAGTYTVTATPKTGGVAAATAVVTINKTPKTPTISGAPTGLICSGNKVTLSVNVETAVNYTWDQGGGLGTSKEFTLPDASAFKVTVTSKSTSTGQCVGVKAEKTITMSTKIGVTKSESICKVGRYDGEVTLNLRNGSVFKAYSDVSYTTELPTQPTKVSEGPFLIRFEDQTADAIYYLKSGDYCGGVKVEFTKCSASSAVLSISTTDADYCEGTTPNNLIKINLTADTEFTQWSFKLKGPDGAMIFEKKVAAGGTRVTEWTHDATEKGVYEIYDFKASDGDAAYEVKDIYDDREVTIIENPKPVATLVADADDACIGADVIFTATPTSGVKYKWDSGAFGGEKTKTVVLKKDDNTHTVQVENTTTKCVSEIQTKTVKGNGVTVTADADSKSIPAASSTTLKLKDIAYYGASTSIGEYRWTPTNQIASGATTATPKTKNLVSGVEFAVVVKDDKGCSSEESKVTVGTSGSVLSLNIEGEGALESNAGCLGEEMNLVAKAGGGSCSNTYDYAWSVIESSTGATLSLEDDTKNKPGIGNTTTSGIYKVECKITCSGVSMADTIDIEIYPKPSVSFTASTTLACTGAELKLTANSSGGTGELEHKWIGDATATGTGAIVDLSVLAGKVDYSVIVEDEKGCVSDTSNVISITGRVVDVSVKLDGKGGSAGSKVVMNNGESGTLTSEVSYSPTDGSLKSFAWTPVDKVEGLGEWNSATTKSLTTGGLFTLKVTDNNDCVGEGEVHYSLTGDKLAVGVSDIIACFDGGQKLTCTPSGGVDVEYEYLWTVPTGLELDDYTIKEPTITKGGVGEHSVKVEVSYKTQKEEGVMKVTIKALPTLIAPENQNQQVNATVELTATASPATSEVAWSGTPGTPTTGTGTATMTAGPFTLEGEKHVYTVVAKDGKCESASKSVTITVVKEVEGITFEEADNVEHCTEADDSVRVIAKGGSGELDFLWERTSSEGIIRLSNNNKSEAAITHATVGTHVFKVTVSDRTNTSVKDVDTLITVVVKQTPDIKRLTLTNETLGGTSAGYAEEIMLTVSGLHLDGATYAWSDSESGSTIKSTDLDKMYTYPLTSTTIYTVVATSDGCIDSLSKTVDIKEPDVISLSFKLDKKCDDSGEEMVLTMLASGGKGVEYDFLLIFPDGGIEQFDGAGPWIRKIALADTGVYVVEDFTAIKNGEDLATVLIPPNGEIDVFFDETPIIEITDGLEQSTCDGVDFILLASSQLDGVTYTWDNKVVNGKPFVPTEAGTYTVTAVSSSTTKCSSTETVEVFIDPKPKVTISSNKPTVGICQYDNITLTAGGDATEFEWNIKEVPTEILMTGTPIEVILNVGGSVEYYVVGTEMTHGCTDTAFLVMEVGVPPVIISTTDTERTVAIDRDVTFEVDADGKDMAFAWQRWDGSGWLILKDNASGKPAISGSTTDALTLKTIPQSWNGTLFRCVVENYCGDVDTTFSLEVTKCFQLLGVEWEMCEGIRPETDPAKRIDGWYCPGGQISICARIIAADSEIDIVNPVYKWKVDGDPTDSEEWGDLEFISDSSVLSWVIPLEWERDVTISLRAYSDGACDTTYERTLRLGASPFTEVDWDLKTSASSENMFCPKDTVTIWVEEENGDENMEHTYKWYDSGFDLAADEYSDNVVVSLENKKLVLAMEENDTWIKVVMTPSVEVCVKDSVFIRSMRLIEKDFTEPKFFISTEDTLACFNDKVYFEAKWENAGENPTFQWYRDVYNLGTDWKTNTDLTSDDMWIKCILTPSVEVCYDTDSIFDDIIQIIAIKDAKVVISTDMEGKTTEDEIVIESDISGMPIEDPIYTWYINNRIHPENEEELISYDLRSNDSIQLGVNGELICQNKIMSNILYIDFDRAKRDTLLTIYQGEEVKNLSMVKPGDDLGVVVFMIEKSAEYGMSSISTNGEFAYTPTAGFIGNVNVAYKLVNKLDQKTVGTGMIYITVKDNNRFTVPNLITPNDDGLNDTWKLDFLMDYPNHRILVYDYLGKKVYEAKDYQNDWDGTNSFANKNFTSGVYTYVIELGDKEKTMLKAWVEIRVDLNRSNFR